MTAGGWEALATVVLATGVVTGGLWALYNHRTARRLEAARWTQAVLHDFYEERFREIKCALQYEYGEKLKTMLEQQNDPDPNRRSGIQGDVSLLEQLDMLLNYFEYMLYLEAEGHFEGRDGHAVFAYWFKLLEAEEFVALRQYIAEGGFGRVARELDRGGEVRVALFQSSSLR